MGTSGKGDRGRRTEALDGHGGGQAASSRPRTDPQHQNPNPVLIQLDFNELEDQAQAGQAPGPHTATKTRIFYMCTTLGDPWIGDISENSTQ